LEFKKHVIIIIIYWELNVYLFSSQNYAKSTLKQLKLINHAHNNVYSRNKMKKGGVFLHITCCRGNVVKQNQN
jgi:hypothetical protein